MRLAIVGVVSALLAPSLEAQSARYRPVPRPAAILWERPAADPPAPTLNVGPTTGAGKGTLIGAMIGGLAGLYLANVGCGLSESGASCGMPMLIGLVGGGLTGAMIGSAFEGDQTPSDDAPAEGGSDPTSP